MNEARVSIPMRRSLLHDPGDTLGSYKHADLAAVLLEPFVSAKIAG
jgi:hypothetical protein